MSGQSLKRDLIDSQEIKDKVRKDDVFAQNLYAALCNQSWIREDSSAPWSCSWRASGGIVADLIGEGDYLDWYCSGINGNNEKYFEEGTVSQEIEQELNKIGWFKYNQDDQKRTNNE